MPQVKYTKAKGLFQESGTTSRFAIPHDGDTAPALAFGTSGAGTIAGTDVSGIVTITTQMSTNGHTMTITFANAYSAVPVVNVSFVGSALTNIEVQSVTASAITIAAVGGATGLGTIHYSVIASE